MSSALLGMHRQESDKDTVKIPISSILLLLSAMRCRRCSSYSTSAMIACVVPTAKGAVQKANLLRVTTPGNPTATHKIASDGNVFTLLMKELQDVHRGSSEGGKGKMPMWR